MAICAQANLPISRIITCLACSSTGLDLDTVSAGEWEEIAVVAIALGLAPLLHWRLEQAGASPPPMIMAKLAVTRRAHTRRNEEIAGQLSDLLAAFAREKIDVLVLKGALLAPIAYAEPGLRPMNDIDLLFRPEALGRTGRVLESLGYVGKHKQADRGPGVTKHLSTYRRPGRGGRTPNPYLSAGSDRTVEPHGSLEESWFGLKVDITPGVWERAVPMTLHGWPTYRLGAADMLLHLAVHAVFHVIMGAPVFVQLYDLGRVVHTWAAELDWPRVVDLARPAGAEPFLYAGLYWAASLYGAPIPPEPLASLGQACPPDLLSYIHSLDAAALFYRTQQPPLTSLGQRLRRGLAERREAARWAGSLAGKWRVWQTALAFHRTDTMAVLTEGLKREV